MDRRRKKLWQKWMVDGCLGEGFIMEVS